MICIFVFQLLRGQAARLQPLDFLPTGWLALFAKWVPLPAMVGVLDFVEEEGAHRTQGACSRKTRKSRSKKGLLHTTRFALYSSGRA